MTISRGWSSINDLADRGESFAAITAARIAAALSETFAAPIVLPADVSWMLPAGAFGYTTGPD